MVVFSWETIYRFLFSGLFIPFHETGKERKSTLSQPHHQEACGKLQTSYFHFWNDFLYHRFYSCKIFLYLFCHISTMKFTEESLKELFPLIASFVMKRKKKRKKITVSSQNLEVYMHYFGVKFFCPAFSSSTALNSAFHFSSHFIISSMFFSSILSFQHIWSLFMVFFTKTSRSFVQYKNLSW